MLENNPTFSIKGKKFNVIILAAGFGTRLRPITDHLPKALVEIKKDLRAIDHLIQKYQYVANRIIIAVGYGADLIENYVKGKYHNLNVIFSREKEEELKNPGRSLLFALDYASSEHPTIISFCDYILEDYINVENDALCVCEPQEGNYVLDTYKSKVIVRNGFIFDVVKNEVFDMAKGGFTGIAIIHNTILLKSIIYSLAHLKGADNIDYTFDLIKRYISEVKTIPALVFKQYEFGTTEKLYKIKGMLNDANN